MISPTRSRGLLSGAVVAIVLGTGLVLSATGFNVALALAALVNGAFGSWYVFGSATLVRSTPLILTGLAVAIAFQGGVFNIGAEGQFLVGATAAVAVALSLPSTHRFVILPAVLLAGAVGGGAWAAISALLRSRFQVLEVISTLMLNFVAAYMVSYLVRGPLQEPLHIYPQTSAIPDAAQLPRLAAATRLHVGFLIAVTACGASWWTIRFTAGGFRLRAIGANRWAAQVAGQIDVNRVATYGFLASGALAGLAGAVEVSGVTYALYDNLSPGYGYTAIAVALLARLNVAAVIATGVLFGALEAGASAMQRDAGVPSVVVSVVEAAIILLLIALDQVRVSDARPSPVP